MNETPATMYERNRKRITEQKKAEEEARLEQEKKARRTTDFRADHPLADNADLRKLMSSLEAQQ